MAPDICNLCFSGSSSYHIVIIKKIVIISSMHTRLVLCWNQVVMSSSGMEVNTLNTSITATSPTTRYTMNTW